MLFTQKPDIERSFMRHKVHIMSDIVFFKRVVMPKKSAFMLDEFTTTLKEIGANIRTARLRRNIKIKDLANRIHVDERTISRMENGDPSISLKNLIAVLYVFGLEDSLSHIASPAEDKEGIALDKLNNRKRAVGNKQEVSDDF